MLTSMIFEEYDLCWNEVRLCEWGKNLDLDRIVRLISE